MMRVLDTCGTTQTSLVVDDREHAR